MRIKSEKTIAREKHKEWREKVLIRDNYKCQLCKRIDGVLNVHHLIPKQFKEFIYDEDNGIVLCFQHHKFGKFSPHQNAVFFCRWLQAVKPMLYAYVITKLNGMCQEWDKKE